MASDGADVKRNFPDAVLASHKQTTTDDTTSGYRRILASSIEARLTMFSLATTVARCWPVLVTYEHMAYHSVHRDNASP
jgi:hypothetical protein